MSRNTSLYLDLMAQVDQLPTGRERSRPDRAGTGSTGGRAHGRGSRTPGSPRTNHQLQGQADRGHRGMDPTVEGRPGVGKKAACRSRGFISVQLDAYKTGGSSAGRQARRNHQDHLLRGTAPILGNASGNAHEH